MEHVLVIGSSGLVGGAITQGLLNNTGVQVSGFSRSGSKLGGVRSIAGDLRETPDVKQALDGISQVVIAVSAKAGQCEELEYRAVVNAARLAQEKGVQRIIYISGASTPYAPDWFEAGAAKKKTEDALVELDLEIVILRPSWLMETLPRFERNGSMSIIGNGSSKIHWLSASDLAKVVNFIVSSASNLSGCYTLFGPEAISLSDAASRYGETRGLKSVQKMPLWLGRFISLFSEELRPTVELIRAYEQFDEQSLDIGDDALPRAGITVKAWLENTAM